MHQRAGSAAGAQEVNQQIEHLSVQDRGYLEVLASGRGSGKNKNSRADDRADAERGQRPWPQGFAQSMLRLVGLGDQFVDGFAAQELAAMGSRGRVGGG